MVGGSRAGRAAATVHTAEARRGQRGRSAAVRRCLLVQFVHARPHTRVRKTSYQVHSVACLLAARLIQAPRWLWSAGMRASRRDSGARALAIVGITVCAAGCGSSGKTRSKSKPGAPATEQVASKLV